MVFRVMSQAFDWTSRMNVVSNKKSPQKSSKCRNQLNFIFFCLQIVPLCKRWEEKILIDFPSHYSSKWSIMNSRMHRMRVNKSSQNHRAYTRMVSSSFSLTLAFKVNSELHASNWTQLWTIKLDSFDIQAFLREYFVRHSCVSSV